MRNTRKVRAALAPFGKGPQAASEQTATLDEDESQSVDVAADSASSDRSEEE